MEKEPMFRLRYRVHWTAIPREQTVSKAELAEVLLDLLYGPDPVWRVIVKAEE